MRLKAAQCRHFSLVVRFALLGRLNALKRYFETYPWQLPVVAFVGRFGAKRNCNPIFTGLQFFSRFCIGITPKNLDFKPLFGFLRNFPQRFSRPDPYFSPIVKTYSWAKHIAIYIGASNGTYIQYRLSTKYDAGGDYVSCKNQNDYETGGIWDDWAVLKLDSAVTASVSKLGVKETNSATEMYGNTYSTQGYPRIEGNITKGIDHWTKWAMYRQTNCKIQGDLAQPYYLHLVNSTNMNFTYGQSGAPVYRNGAAEGIGVGTYGNLYDDPESGSTAIILLNTWLCNRIKTKYT